MSSDKVKHTLAVLLIVSTTACLSGSYTTSRDKTAKGAGIGAAAGAVGAYLAGKREADEILAGAAIGAVAGGSVGSYMDAQEEKVARIPGTSVERIDERTLLVHFDSNILFQVNKASLSGAARSNLDQMAQVLRDFEKTAVVVQGHTDSSGSATHNQGLSERRATSVRDHFSRAGVAGDRMVVVGFGETQPIATNDTAQGRTQNRRVDILLRARAR